MRRQVLFCVCYLLSAVVFASPLWGQDNPFGPPRISGGAAAIAPGAAPTPGSTPAAPPSDAPPTDAPPPEITALVDARRQAMQAVLAAQAAGNQEAFWQAATRLADVQTRLLQIAETILQVDQQELRELRDQHVGLLHRLADRMEPVDLTRCEAIWSESIGHLIKLNGPAHWTTRTAMHELHRVQVTRRLSDDDRRSLEQAVQWHAQVMPLCDAGSIAAADAAARQAWQVRARILGPENIHTLATLHNLGLVLAQAGDLRTSQRLFQDVARAYEQQLGADHPGHALCLTHLADTLRELSQLDEAARVQRRALEILEASTGKQTVDYARALNQLRTRLQIA